MKETTAHSTAGITYAPAELERLIGVVTSLHDHLRTAIQMLSEAGSPFAYGSGRDNEWRGNRDRFIEAVKFDHFGGPRPKAEEHPY